MPEIRTLLSESIVGEQTDPIHKAEIQTTQGNFLIDLYSTFVLKRGQDIDDFSEDLRAKLEYEILNMELVGVITDMVKKGVGFTIENRSGETSLHYMLIEKSVDYVETLINLGLDFSIKNQDGVNCTFKALKCQRYDIFELLSKNGFYPKAPMRDIFLLFKS